MIEIIKNHLLDINEGKRRIYIKMMKYINLLLNK